MDDLRFLCRPPIISTVNLKHSKASRAASWSFRASGVKSSRSNRSISRKASRFSMPLFMAFSSLRSHWHHIVRFLLRRHQLRHTLRMNPVHMDVCIENQFAAVAMTLPFGDYFYVHATLDCARDEHTA